MYKKGLLLITTIMLAILMFTSCSRAESALKEETLNQEITSEYNSENIAYITYADDFSDGIAKVKCETDDKQLYEALIDEQGNTLYICNSLERFIFTPLSKEDIGCITDSDNSFYKFINANGEVVLLLENQEIDKVIACGDGNALVYKYIADIDSTEHQFGVINNRGEL